MSSKNILLVEGEADRAFFEALCKLWGVPVGQVKVATPRDAGHNKNTKQGIFIVLPIYIDQLADGQIERLALMIDADSKVHGGGYDQAIQRLQGILSAKGYNQSPTATGGAQFVHSDGLNAIGAWIMPNNRDEGMLEDWVKQCLHPSEAALMTHAQLSIDQIPGGPKFKSLNRSKAEVATWLAWQTKPDHGLYNAAQTDLLDENAEYLVSLRGWLTQVFP